MEKIICPHKDLCGGCSYQELSYDEQLDIKVNHVKELLSEFAGADEWEETVINPAPYGYRNKMEFSFGDAVKDGPLTLGLHQRKSFYNIINVDSCNIVDEDYRKIMSATLAFFTERGVTYYHKKRGTGALRHLVIRKAAKTGEILVMLVTSSGIYDTEGEILEEYKDMLLTLTLDGTFAGIIHALNDLPADTVQSQKTTILYGQDYFYEELLGLRFKITPFSFFQTNSLGAEKLYSVVREFCGDIAGRKVFDLYSGTGTIAQILASESGAGEVYGVEIVAEAVEAAKENAALNGLDNCHFVAGDVFKVLEEASTEGSALTLPDFIVLDPPREGMTPKALAKILSYEVPRIVYVSCKPESLARDMVGFTEHGYKIDRVKCVDMFSWTKHVETVVLMSRKSQ